MLDIICIIDQSGSMTSIWDDAIGGFNAFVADQKAVEGKARMTVVTFNSSVYEIFDKRPLNEVEELTKKGLVPHGTTALYDAIGTTLNKTRDLADKGIVMILTDGCENSSRKYNKTQAFEIIEGLKAQGWEIIYAGANQDAFAEGGQIGASISLNYAATSDGVEQNYRNMSGLITSYRIDNSGGTIDPNKDGNSS